MTDTSRKCVNCAGYDPDGEPRLKCVIFGDGHSISFESNPGDCQCVYFKPAVLKQTMKGEWRQAMPKMMLIIEEPDSCIHCQLICQDKFPLFFFGCTGTFKVINKENEKSFRTTRMSFCPLQPLEVGDE